MEEIDWGKRKRKPEGKVILKYLPTGEEKELPFGIHVLSYANELVLCETWGYDGGKPTDKNNPNNWEIVRIEHPVIIK